MRYLFGLTALLASTTLAVPAEPLHRRQNNSNSDYELKQGPLDTDWTTEVGTEPWPDYPRPQLQRSDWKNLNGVWRYQNAPEGLSALDSPPFGQELEQAVLVPFCLESALSG
jgi:hypothetical protein